MYRKTIIDEINIKNLPEMITDYLRKNGEKKYINLRSFYTILLDNISNDVKDSYLNRILKYLSNTTPSLINIFEDFNQGIYDKELKVYVKDLVQTINKYENNGDLYEQINSKINFIYYDVEDYLKIKESNNIKDYETFIFLVLKHTFQTYQLNLPSIVSKRLFEEAMTTEYDSERKTRMIKASADLNNIEASMLYANQILLDDPDTAIDYMLKAKSLPYVLWSIGFSIEKQRFSKESIYKIKKELEPLFEKDEFIEKLSSDNKHLLLAVNLYYHIYLKYGFSKAINSIGKLLITRQIKYNNSEKESIEQAKIYLNKAIKLGNVNAITNLSVYYLRHPEDKEYEDLLINKLLRTSAELGDVVGNYYYGILLTQQGKDGSKYFHYSSELNHERAHYELGKYYELHNDYNKSIEYYKKSITCGYTDAIISLSKLYIFLSNKNNKNTYKLYAKELLDNNIDKLNEEQKKLANRLYEDIDL